MPTKIDWEKTEITFNSAGLLIYTLTVILGGFGLCLMLSCGPALEVYDGIEQKALEGQGCEPATTKCIGSQLATCQADHTWSSNVDCGIYVPERACYTKDGAPGCYRPEDKVK